MKLSRTPEGHIAYAASRPTREDPAMMPGAIGRMVAVETVRSQAGEENDEALRVALAAFFKHWNELEKRRSQNGTHDPPYGVAPYYFFYGHGYAAEAIEELPEAERAAWREKLLDRLFEVPVKVSGSKFEDIIFWGVGRRVLMLGHSRVKNDGSITC